MVIHMSAAMAQQDVQELILPIVRRIAQDTSFNLRVVCGVGVTGGCVFMCVGGVHNKSHPILPPQSAASALTQVGTHIPHEHVVDSILPVYQQLASDKVWAVRQAAAKVCERECVLLCIVQVLL